MTATTARRGTAPYGWRWENRTLVEVRHEQHVRWLILHLHRQARSLSQIAAELERLALTTRDGGATWTRTSLHRVITTAAALTDTG